MNDDIIPGEVLESIEFSDQDIADLNALGVETDAPFNPILRIWQEVLKPAEKERAKKVTPQWAARIIASYSGITYQQMNVLRDRYYDKIQILVDILNDEIATDDECLSYTTPEEDAEKNRQHYKNLLRDWQTAVLQWEIDWDCADEYAGVELAAISEVHKMFFGDTGLVPFLENIRFEFTDEDQAELSAALTAVRGEG